MNYKDLSISDAGGRISLLMHARYGSPRGGHGMRVLYEDG
jgi:hypothetical protein